MKSPERNRNIGFAKFTVYFAMIFMFFLTLVALINHDRKILIYDSAVILLLIVSITSFYKRSIFIAARICLVVLSVSSLGLLYMEGGSGGVVFWVFLLIQFYIILFGYKSGGIVAGIISLIYLISYSVMVDDYSIKYLTRYTVAIVGVYTISMYYERLIIRTEQRLQELTVTDSLTSLYNRRYFDEIFSKNINTARRNNNLLVFAMLDIDFFKKYNDSEGHHAGDAVLKDISRKFRDSFHRSEDFVFRIGGEEFAVLFYTEDRDSAFAYIDNLRQGVEDMGIEHPGNEVSPYITISAGLHIIDHQNQKDCDEIYKICDDALYKAKEKGRNRVELSDESL